MFEAELRRQARVCARLAEDCDDPYLAERFRLMASGLASKADELDPPATDRAEASPPNQETRKRGAA